MNGHHQKGNLMSNCFIWLSLGQTAHWKNLEVANARLTSEVTSLRSRQINLQVLQEEKRSLEGQLHKAREQEEQIAQLQAELDAARSERENWLAAFIASAYCIADCLNHHRIGPPSSKTPTPNPPPTLQPHSLAHSPHFVSHTPSCSKRPGLSHPRLASERWNWLLPALTSKRSSPA